MEIVQENQPTNNSFVLAFFNFAKERILTSGKTFISALYNHFREWLKVMSVSQQIFPEWFTSCFSLASASFFGFYPLLHALDCSDHATLKSGSMH